MNGRERETNNVEEHLGHSFHNTNYHQTAKATAAAAAAKAHFRRSFGLLIISVFFLHSLVFFIYAPNEYKIHEFHFIVAC